MGNEKKGSVGWRRFLIRSMFSGVGVLACQRAVSAVPPPSKTTAAKLEAGSMYSIPLYTNKMCSNRYELARLHRLREALVSQRTKSPWEPGADHFHRRRPFGSSKEPPMLLCRCCLKHQLGPLEQSSLSVGARSIGCPRPNSLFTL